MFRGPDEIVIIINEDPGRVAWEFLAIFDEEEDAGGNIPLDWQRIPKQFGGTFDGLQEELNTLKSQQHDEQDRAKVDDAEAVEQRHMDSMSADSLNMAKRCFAILTKHSSNNADE